MATIKFAHSLIHLMEKSAFAASLKVGSLDSKHASLLFIIFWLSMVQWNGKQYKGLSYRFKHRCISLYKKLENPIKFLLSSKITCNIRNSKSVTNHQKISEESNTVSQTNQFYKIGTKISSRSTNINVMKFHGPSWTLRSTFNCILLKWWHK